MCASSNIFREVPCGGGNVAFTTGISRAISALACAIVTPGFSRADALEAEVPEVELVAVELKGHEDRRIAPSESMESVRQNADNLPQHAVHLHAASDHRAVAREFALPVSVRDHRRLRRARRIVLPREHAAEHRL